MAWDTCGCAGFCGYAWLGRESVTEMVAWGRPCVLPRGRGGGLSEWRSVDGAVLVLVEGEVRWGAHLA